MSTERGGDPLKAQFVAEGIKARKRNKKRADCPYVMSRVVVGGAVLRASLQARDWWLQGWDQENRRQRRKETAQ